jgi:hypothetical protein
MSLTKTSLWRLKPGSEVIFGSLYLGYTQGGSIKIERVFEDIDCQKYGIVGAKLLDYTATISLSLLQYDEDTKDVIFGSPDYGAEPSYTTLKVTYLTRGADPQEMDIEFKQAYVFDTGEIPIHGNKDIPFPVVFKAVKDSSGQVVALPETGGGTT